MKNYLIVEEWCGLFSVFNRVPFDTREKAEEALPNPNSALGRWGIAEVEWIKVEGEEGEEGEE